MNYCLVTSYYDLSKIDDDVDDDDRLKLCLFVLEGKERSLLITFTDNEFDATPSFPSLSIYID